MVLDDLPHPPDDHTTTYATYASSVTWWKRSTRTLTSPPPPWRSYDNICNICLFRNVMEALDTNVNIPPPPPHPPHHPHPPDDHTTTYATYASSMCNTLKNRKFQILYPHFGKPHFWNLQPFHGIVNGTSQNRQPFQGRRISRMPKTTIACMTNTWRSFSRFWASHLHPRGSCAGLHRSWAYIQVGPPAVLDILYRLNRLNNHGHENSKTARWWILWSILWSDFLDFIVFFPFFPVKHGVIIVPSWRAVGSRRGCLEKRQQIIAGMADHRGTWWLIPRIVSGLVHPNYKWINPTKIPFITGVISHLLSGMSHQVNDGKCRGCWSAKLIHH